MQKQKAICKVCGKEFEYDPRVSKGLYCSRECRYKDHSNIIKNSYTDERRKLQSDNAKRQMSDKAQIEIRKDKLSKIKHSEEWNMKNSEAHQKHVDYRKIAFEAHGCTCARCGKKLTEQEAVVHHINGEHFIDELTDNSPENLMVLCRSCHTKLHHEQKDFINKFVGITQFEKAANNILDGLKRMGFKLDDANFKDTPKRMARAYYEIFEGVQDTDEKVANILSTSFPSDGHNDMVLDTNIIAFSMCPHHLLPVEYRVAIAYIPDPEGHVLGLSKLSRLAILLAKQPALQEDYTQQIVKALEKIHPQGVAVMVEGRHMCMRMRGVRSPEASVVTSAVSGCFKENSATKMEFLSAVKGTFKW
jgi:GTP cyclohydrolase I